MVTIAVLLGPVGKGDIELVHSCVNVCHMARLDTAMAQYGLPIPYINGRSQQQPHNSHAGFISDCSYAVSGFLSAAWVF